jgi:hypothetical protein
MICCILEILSLECINEPRGKCGMEGFVRDAQYMATLVFNPQTGGTYFRVYHSGDYYETCSKNTLGQHFKTCNPVVSDEFDFNFMLGYSDFVKKQLTEQYARRY